MGDCAEEAGNAGAMVSQYVAHSPKLYVTRRATERGSAREDEVGGGTLSAAHPLCHIPAAPLLLV